MTATTFTSAAPTVTTAARRRPRTKARRWSTTRAAIARWWAAGQLGPVDNYVIR